jgi:pimeloyl-ACP methyl ester carboxylesterase
MLPTSLCTRVLACSLLTFGAIGCSTSQSASDGGAGTEASVVAGYGKYSQDGPATVTTTTVGVTPPVGSAFEVTLYVPSTSGPRPLVFLSSGFTQNALAYGPYAQRLASWGIIALLRSDPGIGEATADVVRDAEYVIDGWLPGQNQQATGPLSGRVDLGKLGLAGHSRGGQVALLAGEGVAKGKIRGVFGLDPVDTSMDASPEARTQIGTIGVPLAFIGETTDGTGAMPCAPLADDYQVLFAAASPPVVAMTAVGADHTMFEDPTHCVFCGLCTPGTADAGAVLDLSVRYLTAFFARELLGDTSVGATFEGAGASLDVEAGLVTVESR